MKAVIIKKYGGPDVLEIADVEKPAPKDDELLIRIDASAVVATDPVFRKGEPFIARFFTGLLKPKHFIPGDVLAGVVESVGRGVTRFNIGDPVYAACAKTQGGQAEYICLPENGPLAVRPANMTCVEAAGVCDGALGALNFLRDAAKISSGQSVLINGASGSVGTYAVQIAKYYGARVTGVCSAKNASLVKSLGADEVIDYTAVDFTQCGKTFDIVFDAVGKSTFARCKKILASGGVFVTSFPGPGDFIRIMLSSKSKGKRGAIIAPGLRKDSQKAEDLKFLTELIEKGFIKSVTDRRYPPEEIREAHKYVEAGHKAGNVILTFARDE